MIHCSYCNQDSDFEYFDLKQDNPVRFFVIRFSNRRSGVPISDILMALKIFKLGTGVRCKNCNGLSVICPYCNHCNKFRMLQFQKCEHCRKRYYTSK